MRNPSVLVIFLLAAALLFAAAPAEAYHWHYAHPLWGWGWWAHDVGPFYPPVVYASPPVVIQSAPQTYGQRQAVEQPQQIVWYWCTEPQGFFPHVRECKGNAWMRVLPDTTPPQAPPQR